MSNLWDERPFAETGSKSENDIFLAVGKALSNWELVEQSIAGIFTVVTVGVFFAPAAPTLRAYSSVASSHNRIQMVRAAVESWLTEWKDCPCGQNALDLLSESQGWAARRNDIAHGIADRFIDEIEKGWFLIPSIYSIKGRKSGKADYRYNARIIDKLSERFVDLDGRLNEVQSMMKEWHRIASDQRERQKSAKQSGG